jgi:hypothetical protein
MTSELARRVAAAVGADVVAFEEPPGQGYTHNERLIARLADGRSVFVKAAVDELTATWLRDEHRIYAAVLEDYLPALLGWQDDEALPVLVLEDLSGAQWPPPWSAERVSRVVGTLERVAATRPPEGLESLEARRGELAGWELVLEDPGPFLSVGLCSPPWLEAALPVLLAAAQACVLTGDALIHFDVRSDNLCFTGERTVLVDWNWAAVGNPVVDVAAWLPSLEAEGGPPPDEILPDAPEAASLVAGFFAARTGLPPPPKAPRVREVQLAQLRSALPWAARALELAPPV